MKRKETPMEERAEEMKKARDHKGAHHHKRKMPKRMMKRA
jgi:hypothetical protein